MNSRILFNLVCDLRTTSSLCPESRAYCQNIFPESSLFFLLKGKKFLHPGDFIPVSAETIWETLHNDPAGIFCRRIEPDDDSDMGDFVLCVSLLGKDAAGDDIAAGIIYSEGWGNRSGQEELFYNIIAELKRFYSDFAASRAVNLFLNDKSLVRFVIDPDDKSIIARRGLESDESETAQSIWSNIISEEFLETVLSRDSEENEKELPDGPIRNFNMARFKLNHFEYAMLSFRCPVLQKNFPDYDLVIRNFAHRIRNKLGALQSAASQLNISKGKIIEEKEMAMAEIIQKACHSTVMMVDRLHQFSRLSQIQTSPLNLGETISKVIKKKKSENSANIVINYQTDNQAGTIMGDAEQIETAIAELLDNAISPGEKIDITFRNENNKATLVIHNRAENRTNIAGLKGKSFDLGPFVSTQPGRSGMGLTMVRRIVANHGGSTAIEYDQDSGFSVTLDFPTVARR
jgi:signal transduction histidine kinase